MGRISRLLVLSLLLCMLVAVCDGCIPHAELSAYKAQFDTARTASEDLVLGLKNAAQQEADDPSSGKSASERARELQARLDALDARLEALQVITQYNDALVRLASGEDSASVKASLENFSTALNSFSIKSLTTLLAGAAPYGELAATAIAGIDKLIQAKRFEKALEKGEAAVLGILDILGKDAASALVIRKQRLELVLDPHKLAAQVIAIEFENQANQHRFSDPALAPRFAILVVDQNKLRPGIRKDFVHAPRIPTTTAPTTTDDAAIASLAKLNDQMRPHIELYTSIQAQLDAENELIKQYKAVLASTAHSLQQIRIAMKDVRAVAVSDFIKHVYAMRQAYLAARESRNK